MASITIRNLDDSVKEALRRRAAGNRRSMEEEARQIIGLELRRDRSMARKGLGTRLAEIWAEAGGVDLVLPEQELVKDPHLFDDDES